MTPVKSLFIHILEINLTSHLQNKIQIPALPILQGYFEEQMTIIFDSLHNRMMCVHVYTNMDKTLNIILK